MSLIIGAKQHNLLVPSVAKKKKAAEIIPLLVVIVKIVVKAARAAKANRVKARKVVLLLETLNLKIKSLTISIAMSGFFCFKCDCLHLETLVSRDNL
jgi:hypothetical protein